jgi:integrase/recombinase XerD
MTGMMNGKPYQEYLAARVRGEVPRSKKATLPLDKGDAQLIQEYLDNKITMEGHLNDRTAHVVASYLVMWSNRAGPFKTMTEARVKEAVIRARKELKVTTQRRFFGVTKSFMLWLADKGHSKKITPEFISQIKGPKRSSGEEVAGRSAGNMLTADEIKALINAARNTRDRCIIAVLYESGMRPNELCSLTWGQLVSDQYGYQLTVTGKTGKPRYIRLVWSTSYINDWKNEYPYTIERASPVIVSEYFNQDTKKPWRTTPSRIRTLVREAGTRARIKKNVFAYVLRHSRITQMVADEIPLPVILEQMWGSQDGRMMSTYVHMKNADVDRIILGRAGKLDTKPRKQELVEPICPRCGTQNKLAAKFCDECAQPLTEEAKAASAAAEDKFVSEFEAMSPEEQLEFLRWRKARRERLTKGIGVADKST